MLSHVQAEQIKEQLISQLENSQMQNKEEIKESILAMSESELEDFLVKNKLIKTKDNHECIFCSIIKGEIPSYKLNEGQESIAVLEINPVSKGHSLVIPKEHVSSREKMPKSAFSLAKKLSKKIKTKLKPKEVKIETSNLFGHEIINIFPVYSDESIKSARKPANDVELEEVKSLLEKKERKKSTRVRQPKPKKIELKEQKLWLPRRIP